MMNRAVTGLIGACATVAVAVMGGLVPLSAAAGQRTIIVNGQGIAPARADACAGFHVPSGRYWLDLATGLWGPVGAFAVGRVHPSCRGGGSAYTDRGPGGSMGSDGRCSYYNDPSTGASVMVGDC